jgi:hypothetical protein
MLTNQSCCFSFYREEEEEEDLFVFNGVKMQALDI